MFLPYQERPSSSLFVTCREVPVWTLWADGTPEDINRLLSDFLRWQVNWSARIESLALTRPFCLHAADVNPPNEVLIVMVQVDNPSQQNRYRLGCVFLTPVPTGRIGI